MPRPLPSRADIVRCLSEADRGLHAREVASRCRVPEGSYSHLLELLDQLSFDGSIRRLAGNRFKAQPAEVRDGGSWEGLLSMNPRGFGFVTAAGQIDPEDARDHDDAVWVQRHGEGYQTDADSAMQRPATEREPAAGSTTAACSSRLPITRRGWPLRQAVRLS